jgi:hypothetical protein
VKEGGKEKEEVEGRGEGEGRRKKKKINTPLATSLISHIPITLQNKIFLETSSRSKGAEKRRREKERKRGRRKEGEKN